MNLRNYLISVVLLIFMPNGLLAHDFSGKARYVANEGVVVESGDAKLMFDPFFHNDYGVYALVPEKMRKAIFEGKAPYDKMDAVFISHAHSDHFDSKDVIKYLSLNKEVLLFAPEQAVVQLAAFPDFQQLKSRVHSVSLKKDQPAIRIDVQDLVVEAVRIPHAGWPQRANVENIVFRVGGKKQIRVMHFGDADPDEAHYKIHEKFWQSKRTDISFVPYWFGLTQSGQKLMASGINTEKAVGVHVPKNVPKGLKESKLDFFHTPGEIRTIEASKSKQK